MSGTRDDGTQRNAMESFFSTTDCGIMRHTANGAAVLSINKAALRILGYESKEELMEEGFHLVAASVLDEDKARLREKIRQLKHVGDSTSIEYRVCHRDGKILEVLGGIKLLEENGELIYQRYLVDRTEQKRQERKELREKEKSHMEMIQALSIDYNSAFSLDLDTGDGFAFRFDEDLRQNLGPEFSEHMDLESGVRLYAQKMVCEEDRDILCAACTMETMKRELEHKISCYLNYRTSWNGVTEYHQMKAVRVGEWGRSHKAVVGFRSVDEEIRSEMEQKQLLESALAQAKNASQAKTTFLNNMSHDIRTPMNAIIGYASLASSHIEQTDLVRDYLEKIRMSSNHLLSLINDVLDMSRIESGKMKIEEAPYNLFQLIQELQNILQPDIEARQLQLCIDTSEVTNPDVICDKLRLNQILINCLSNAVKFTASGGRISALVTQETDARPGYASYVFRVSDTGIGMSSEFVRHIFEPFERERTSTVSGIQGTGLGMAITKNLVDLMGGTIGVSSELGCGTTFTITVPLRLQKPFDDSADTVTAPGKVQITDLREFSGKRLLLVDDVEMNQEIAETVLTEAGFYVDCVEDGLEAVNRIREIEDGTYDLILMDIQMPVMNGYDSCRQIRALEDPAKAQIPILAMTADAFEEDRQRAFEAGMNGHISKPIQIQALYDALKQLFLPQETAGSGD